MARFIFHAPVRFEPWDWRNPDEVGIGGSETQVCEMARRLALRGHDVTVHAPIRPDCPARDPGGARWLPLDAADFAAPGVWVLSRCPRVLDRFPAGHPGQSTWLVCQDVDYRADWEDGLSPDRSARLDLCLPLCPAHERYLLREHPGLAGKTRLSTNGLRTDLIESIEAGGVPERDPFRLVYTSSPDRGLPALLRIFKRAREFEPRLTLRAAYGFDNIDKCEGRHWRSLRAECERLMDQPGVEWLGRMPQAALYREFLSAGLWVYPTTFTETSCCTSMEAQGCGAIPICNPIWALEDNVRHGSFLAGDPNEPLTEARYVGEILRWTGDPAMRGRGRAEMMAYARGRFNWERVADQYEALALGFADRPMWIAQYAFQLRHATGRILNVGCNADAAGFGAHGGVNLDLHATDPHHGGRNPADVIADARRPLPFGREFDSVVLGDILEHMTDADAIATLRNAAAVLADGGRVVVTCPEDRRRDPDPPPPYADGIPAHHQRTVTPGVIRGWIAAAGLRERASYPIDYGFCKGLGVVACS